MVRFCCIRFDRGRRRSRSSRKAATVQSAPRALGAAQWSPLAIDFSTVAASFAALDEPTRRSRLGVRAPPLATAPSALDRLQPCGTREHRVLRWRWFHLRKPRLDFALDRAFPGREATRARFSDHISDHTHPLARLKDSRFWEREPSRSRTGRSTIPPRARTTSRGSGARRRWPRARPKRRRAVQCSRG
jgi:hypothetical protein